MEKHVYYLCEGMQSKGHQIYVWCNEGPLNTLFAELGVEIVTRKIAFDIDPFYIVKLAGYLRKNKIEIVHAHEVKAVANALIAAFLAGVPIRISHTHTPISEWRINKFKKALNLFFYPLIVNLLATYEVALTPSRKKIKIKEGIREKKLIVFDHPNCIKTEDFNFDEEERAKSREEILTRHKIPLTASVWGCIGRISEEKGHKVLLEAFGKFLSRLSQEERKDHYLIFVGGGPLASVIGKSVGNMGLHEQVIITGRFLEEDKKKYYASLNYFVHPSLAEGFGIVLLEAMVSGITVLASDLEVFKEVGGDTINYFRTGDVNDLAANMLNTLSSKKDLDKQRQQAYLRVKDFFTFDKFINTYQAFYLELLNK